MTRLATVSTGVARRSGAASADEGTARIAAAKEPGVKRVATDPRRVLARAWSD